MPPEKHALLSASSASRWLVCTAAPRFEEGLPESTSSYAEEGRLAHAIAELKVLKKFTIMTNRTFNSRLNKLKKEPLYDPEMDKTTDLYLEHLLEQAMTYNSSPTVAAEVKVDFVDYVPEGFGTCDCVMIGGDTLCITDYKHGKGVPVSAEGNPQMRLYALGALKRYAPIFGDTIKKVRMSIDQPRLDSYTTDTITVEELRAWGESIKPIAQKAFSGLGEFVPGDHCRFCRGKAQCRARANVNTALEDFAGYIYRGDVFLFLTPEHLHDKGRRHYAAKSKKEAARAPRGQSIEKRPEEVKSRGSFGHWEMDSIMGCKGSKQALLVLTERRTRMGFVILVEDHTAASVVKAINGLERRFGKLFYKLFKSITVDNGCEFQDFEGIEMSHRRKGKRTVVFFCHPYSAYERGSNENMNRLIRRFFPKGTNFDEVTEEEVMAAERWVNNYPRKILGWKSAAMLFDQELQAA